MIMEVVDDIEDVNKTTMRILVTRIMMSSVTKVVRLDCDHKQDNMMNDDGNHDSDDGENHDNLGNPT